MVNNCCVVECTNSVKKKPGLRFFSFPVRDKPRFRRWVTVVRRDKWKPKPHSRICNEHFVEGKSISYTYIYLLEALLSQSHIIYIFYR